MSPFELENKLKDSPAWVRREIEKAYRRGYAQGAHWSVESKFDRLSRECLLAWLDALTWWRHGSLVGKNIKTPPPEPWYFEKKGGGK